MAIKATRDETLYLQARGLRIQAPKALNKALRLALEDMQTTLYGEAEEELTAAEQAVLRRGGLVLEEQPGRDPLADTAVKYAAIIESSLSTSEAGKRLGFGAGRIRPRRARTRGRCGPRCSRAAGRRRAGREAGRRRGE